MKSYQEITVTTNVLKAITCNKCGTTTELSEQELDAAVQENLHHSFQLNFGYGSDFDEEQWEFDLCEGCLADFVKSFAIKPKTTEL